MSTKKSPPVLTRDAILNADDLKRVRMPVPELGGEIIVKEMTLAQRIEFEQFANDDPDNARALVIVFSVVDEDDQLIFEPQDYKALTGKGYEWVKTVSDRCFVIQKLLPGAVEKEKENF